MPDSRLPLYQKAIDWDSFFRDWPPPDVFAETVWQWPADRVRDWQQQQFAKIIELGWSNGFYKRRWQAAGLAPGDITSLDDLVKLPSFNSDDIKDNQQEHPPFGDIQGVGLADLPTTPIKVLTSGGTTGKPRPTLFGPIEREMLGLTTARGLYLQGARPGDVMQIPVTCTLAALGWGFAIACNDYLGILPLTTGTGVVTPSRRQLEIAFDLGANLWVSFPEYLTQLAKVCRDELGRDITELDTKLITTFLGPDLDGTLRAQLEALYGCDVYDNYGTHEIGLGAFECQAKDGLHFMEDCMVFEILDPETGQPVADGEAGNLVVTMLARTIPPIIRYNLRDLGRVKSTALCSCGSHFRRMDHFLGRSDDMIKLRGVNVYPMACLRAIMSDKRTTGEWICVVDRHINDGVIRDEMTVHIETRKEAGAMDGLADALKTALRTDLGVGVDVALVAEGELGEVANIGREGKARRLLDRRFDKK